MAVKGQWATYAVQQTAPLFNHLVGSGEQYWYREVFLNYALTTS